ncbi:MAG: LuxR C-terminal-related transcriptional regulator, partial [Chloroflexota bacterium]
SLPLPRYRVRGQLNELRAADLRFTPEEAAAFLNQAMGLSLSAAEIAALATRTEGWIAGLQLAALSLRGQQDTAGFISSFTGSHRFVLDYLIEEVLQQQSESVQSFLLVTSILDRMCGSLCDAVLCNASVSGQETLEHLERANLFIVPLDEERRWYRYHHLFAELLRQRLQQSAASSPGDVGRSAAELHLRASQWYEDNGLEIEAFHHAAAANDVERAERLVEGDGMPLQFRGALLPVVQWLESLPRAVLDARPTLWVTYASALAMAGQLSGAEEKMQAAEAALPAGEPDPATRNLIGHIAALRAMLAAVHNDADAIVAQSQRALEYLHPGNLAVRTATVWTLGHAYQLQGNRAAAGQAFREAIAASQASGNGVIETAATTGLGIVQEAQNQLPEAAQTYRQVLQLAGDPEQSTTCDAHLGLARILSEWNELGAARQHAELGTRLTQQRENADRVVTCQLVLARLRLAEGDLAGAAAHLDQAQRQVREGDLAERLPEVAGTQVVVLLRQGDLAVAAQLAQTHPLPLSQARVRLAQGDPSAALAALEPWRGQVEATGWPDERLKVLVLQALALQQRGDVDRARQLLGDALALAEPGGFIRIFLDEGAPMAQMLSEAASRGIRPEYLGKLLAAFAAEEQPVLAGHQASPGRSADKSHLSPPPSAQPSGESLSQRELEVLQLIAKGLSNREIGERLFLALDTVKGHNRRIFEKLQVQRRTEAVVRARELDLL